VSPCRRHAAESAVRFPTLDALGKTLTSFTTNSIPGAAFGLALQSTRFVNGALCSVFVIRSTRITHSARPVLFDPARKDAEPWPSPL